MLSLLCPMIMLLQLKEIKAPYFVVMCPTNVLPRSQLIGPRHSSDLIGLNQSAFTEGRSIVDNILFTQELVRGYHKDG